METGSNVFHLTPAVAATADGRSQHSVAQICAGYAQSGGSFRKRMPACPSAQWCSRTSWQTCMIICQVSSTYRDANVLPYRCVQHQVLANSCMAVLLPVLERLWQQE